MAKEVKTAVEATDATASTTKAMKRGTIIQAVKAIAVLVCICLVCGALLALCHDLFYISDEERFNRSMAKIYPELDVNAVKTVDLDSSNAMSDYGEVKSVVTDGKVYIIEALGVGGYDNGTVTLYVIVNKDAKIVSWVVKENVGQSYIDKVPANAGTTWYVGKGVDSALDLDMTGATVVKTSTAICNAINAAAYYCRTALANELGVVDLEGEAKTAIKALLGDDYSSYTLTTAGILNSNIDANNTVKATFKVGDDEINFIMYANGEKGEVKAYVYGDKIVAFANGEVILSEGLTEDDALVTAVTEHNGKLNVVKSGSYTGFGYVLSVDTSAGTVYSVSGIKFNTDPSTYVLNVTIVQGAVTAIAITTDGWLDGVDQGNANILATSLVGVTLDTIGAKYDSDKVGGATQSANLIRIAVETALRDYDANHASNN